MSELSTIIDTNETNDTNKINETNEINEYTFTKEYIFTNNDDKIYIITLNIIDVDNSKLIINYSNTKYISNITHKILYIDDVTNNYIMN
jgi:hypothetical protein